MFTRLRPQLPGEDWEAYVKYVEVEYEWGSEGKRWVCPACGQINTSQRYVCSEWSGSEDTGCGRKRIILRVVGPRGGEGWHYFMQLNWERQDERDQI